MASQAMRLCSLLVSAMDRLISLIITVAVVAQVAESVVIRNAVVVAYLHTGSFFTQESQRHQTVYSPLADFAQPGK
nr:hypothetical protein [Rhodococcus sp. 15-649-2-2]